MVAGAVGGGDQYGGDLRVAVHLVFQLLEVQAFGPQAALHGGFHIHTQRRPIADLAAPLEEGWQGHARRQRWDFAVHAFAFVEQQVLQAL